VNIPKFAYILGLAVIVIFSLPTKILAAPTYNDAVGTYTDDFATTGGVVTSSGAGVNTSTGVVQLRNSSNGYTAPYNTTGYIKTAVVRPLRIAKWGTLSIVSTIPEGTSIKVQIMDDGGTVYSDSVISGNSTGLTSFPIDLSGVSPFKWEDWSNGNKAPMIQFKFIFSTTNTSVTPTIDSLTLTWSLTQGDLTTSLKDTSVPYGTNERYYFGSAEGYANSSVYPAFRWASEKVIGNFWYPTLIAFEDRIFGSDGAYAGHIFTLDKDTGIQESQSLWSAMRVFGNATSAGTLFGSQINDDIVYSIDTNNSTVKWVYNYKEGHGNGDVTIGQDGTLYNIWHAASGTKTVTLNAFNQDSTIKFTKIITLIEGTDEISWVTPISVGVDGTLYFVSCTRNPSTYAATPYSRLNAVDPDDGTLLWSLPLEYASYGGNIGADGTIYAYEWTYLADHEPKVFAVNPNGTVKWSKSLGTSIRRGAEKIWFDNNGDLIAVGPNNTNWDELYYILDKDTGDILNFVDMGARYYNLVLDSNYGMYASSYSEDYVYTYPAMYFDSGLNLKWKISFTYDETCTEGENTRSYIFGSPVLDERGWAYQGLSAQCEDADYNTIYDETYSETFASAPWTLSSYTDALFTGVAKGSTIHFFVTTSMLEENPVFGGDNQVQVIMDNGNIVPLTYSNLNSSGDSIWTGSYTLPTDIASGTHTYTVEASQAYLKTDITTHFATVSTNTENTGITTTGTFKVKEVSTYNPIYRLVTTDVLVDDPVVEETIQRVFRFVDQNGLPMVNAVITIDGEEYIADSNGEITLENVGEVRTYTAKITYNGKTYTEEILGVSNGEEEIVIDTGEVQEDVAVVEDNKTSIWIYIIPTLVILVGGGVVLLNKKQSI